MLTRNLQHNFSIEWSNPMVKLVCPTFWQRKCCTVTWLYIVSRDLPSFFELLLVSWSTARRTHACAHCGVTVTGVQSENKRKYTKSASLHPPDFNTFWLSSIYLTQDRHFDSQQQDDNTPPARSSGVGGAPCRPVQPALCAVLPCSR